MFYHFIYLAKGFRMRPKVRTTLRRNAAETHIGLTCEISIFKDFLF